MAGSGGNKPSIGLVGPGALGTALSTRLHAAGYPVLFIAARGQVSALALAAKLGTEAVGLPDLARHLPCDILFCCVPDDAIPSVAQRLAPLLPNWEGTVVAHTSGAGQAALLSPLGQSGAAMMSFHPLQTFTGIHDADLFKGIHIALEGEPAAVAVGRQMATDMGCRHILLDADTKPLYHLAATTASNSLSVLVAMAQELMNTVGIDSITAIQMLQPLIETTWRNILQFQPEEALTGPVVRGDVTTIERHITAIERHAPHLAPAFAALVTEAVRLSVRSGRLHIEPADAILERIHALLTGSEV
jgi:predicted short-subunit dehydrogenase-like oxidoreductase (DUF2520 family)